MIVKPTSTVSSFFTLFVSAFAKISSEVTIKTNFGYPLFSSNLTPIFPVVTDTATFFKLLLSLAIASRTSTISISNSEVNLLILFSHFVVSLPSESNSIVTGSSVNSDFGVNF